MKKTLVALALSSVAGFAFAGSSVTLYGILDGGVAVSKNKGADTKVQMVNGVYQGNRWGIKGVEDLGNGNSVFFQLEQGYKLSNGAEHKTGKAFSRQTNVGLRGSWGEASIGRFGALSSDCGSYAILGGSPITTSYWAKGNINGAITTTGRYDNSVVYVTPSFGGLKVSAMYSNGTSDDSNKWSKNGHYYGLGATYAAGGFNANAIVEVLDHKNVNDVDQKSTELFTLGASYDFGRVAIYGAYQYALHTQDLYSGDITVSDIGAPKLSQKGANQHGFALSASTPILGGKFAIEGNYSFGKLKDAGVEQDKYSVWSVGAAYTYPLSKRTLVYSYAGYGQTYKALKKANADSGLSGYVVSLGLRHSF
jgi:predicted porin